MGILSGFNLLFKGYKGTQRFGGTVFITALSNPSFSPKLSLLLPEVVSSKFYNFVPSSCNGLLFLDDYTGNCLLWNPSNGEQKLLPLTTSLVKEAAHPPVTVSPIYCSGFGYDRKAEDYKVVRFLHNRIEEQGSPMSDLEYVPDCFEDGPDSESEAGPEPESEAGPEPESEAGPEPESEAGPEPESEAGPKPESEAGQEFAVEVHRVELYSLNSDSWKQISYPLQLEPHFEYSVYIDGFCFWIASGRSFDDMRILSFDFADEEFSSYPMPCDFLGDREVKLIELDRSIAVVSYGAGMSFDLWVWDGEHWTEKGPITEPIPDVEYLLGCFKNGKQMFFENSYQKLCLYDVDTKKLKEMDMGNDLSGTMELIHYVESSVRLGGKSLGKKRRRRRGITILQVKEKGMIILSIVVV
ncbi:hypothetical protein PTKIN_Ptkin02bG0253000 [Pterospermum kingtungense]